MAASGSRGLSDWSRRASVHHMPGVHRMPTSAKFVADWLLQLTLRSAAPRLSGTTMAAADVETKRRQNRAFSYAGNT